MNRAAYQKFIQLVFDIKTQHNLTDEQGVALCVKVGAQIDDMLAQYERPVIQHLVMRSSATQN